MPLLSRVADSVYWIARYIERAENVARFIGVNLNLQIDLPLAPGQQWQPLIETGGDAALFKERFGEATQARVIEFLAYDHENPNSIASCLRAARENARSVRETISSEMWAQTNAMFLQIQSQRSLPEPERMLDAFREIRMGCHLFFGVTDATMTHNEAWHFMRLGRTLERADKTSRILDVKYFMLLPSAADIGTPYDDIHWAAVLKSVSGFEMYRKRFGRITPADVVDFLVMDREFPRAVRYCGRWPQRLAWTWSSRCRPAAPARVRSRVVRAIENAAPQPVSASTSSGSVVAADILRTSSQTSFRVVMPRSGSPKEAFATPAPDRYIARNPLRAASIAV